ncbi:MAG TPA: hypothetical protein VJR89_28220, partial [Polyangiales bacterium]|nr:hypothetical protein [Polyangiales bacterium]
MRRSNWWACHLVLALLGCAPQPTLVASNCDDPKRCGKAEALKIDAVDILLVVDSSPSIASSARALKQELPQLLNAITSGAGEQGSFPAARSVHVAVTTGDLGIGADGSLPGCNVLGQDGVFVKPGERELSCDVKLPSYLAFEGGPAAVATVDTVSCVPLVGPQDQNSPVGCGYEQPLEAALKALWPAADDSVQFLAGAGHGDAENAGFLRENSLLVVVVVTDEDDCSAADWSAFEQDGPVNLACLRHADKLRDTSRYVEALRDLRPNNPNLIFAVIGGVPVELLRDEFRADYDFTDEADVARYYDAVLADARMQVRTMNEESTFGRIVPSCNVIRTDGTSTWASPPRRLIELAKAFGTRSVLGSLCGDSFGSNTGRLIRAIGERLANPAA